MNPLKHPVRKGQMLPALPPDAVLCQHMVVTADSQADSPVIPVGDSGIGQRIKIQVNHIIQGPHGTGNNMLHFARIIHINGPQAEAGQVTDHKISRPCGLDHRGLPIYLQHLSRYTFYGRHVLGNLGAQVGTVYDAPVAVGIGPVYRIPVKDKGCACLHRGLDNQAHHIL